jgi:hypothetical protein
MPDDDVGTIPDGVARPDFFRATRRTDVASPLKAVQTDSAWEIGATRLFGNFDLAGAGLLSGWSSPEDPHIWNDGPEAVLQIVTEPVKRSLRLSIEGTPFIGGGCNLQEVTLYVNGMRAGFWRLRESKSYILSATIEPEQMFERNGHAILTCVWHLPRSARPVDMGLGKDTRELGFCFRSVTLS